jgi:hypothetical protein
MYMIKPFTINFPDRSERRKGFRAERKIKTKLRDFSQQANSTDRATATFVDRGCRVVSATDPHGR